MILSFVPSCAPCVHVAGYLVCALCGVVLACARIEPEVRDEDSDSVSVQSLSFVGPVVRVESDALTCKIGVAVLPT